MHVVEFDLRLNDKSDEFRPKLINLVNVLLDGLKQIVFIFIASCSSCITLLSLLRTLQLIHKAIQEGNVQRVDQTEALFSERLLSDFFFPKQFIFIFIIVEFNLIRFLSKR